MWVKTTTAGGVYAYQGSGGWASGNMTFYLNEGSDSGYGTKAGGVSYAQGWEEGSTTVNDGNWHFLVMTCNGSTKAMYMDGNVDTVALSWAPTTGVGTQLWIGGSADTGDEDVGLGGLIDGVCVYNSALTQAQIQSLYSSNPAGPSVLPATTAVSVAAGATLDVGGVSQTIGSLTGLGGSSVILADVTNATGGFTVGNASNTVFAGTISGTGSLTKAGTGTLILSGANTYSGNTVISNGTLAVNNASGSATGTGNVTVLNGGTLDGNGAISGAIAVSSGGLLAPGNPLGTLTVKSNLTLASGSTVLVQVQHSPLTNSALKVSGTLTYGGTLSVTNPGASLLAGDTFPIFSAATYAGSFAATNLPPLGINLYWTNTLAANGTLAVVSGVSTVPTNITWSVSGTNLTLSWPADHAGWRLLMQTNNLAAGLNLNTNNWTTVTGSATTNQVTLPFDPAQPAEFYRLTYP
jgi:autotransporter-associated beta strand protein